MRIDSAQAQQVYTQQIAFEASNTQNSKTDSFNIGFSSRSMEKSLPSAAPAQSAPISRLAPRDLMLLQNRDVSVEERADYEHMLSQFTAAKNQGQDPVDFLRNLSKEGIDLLKKVHSFPAGASINIEDMSEEEAINFIVPDSAQVDLNNDGLIGSANNVNIFHFPPPNAPQDIKNAWEKAMEGLSEKDQFLAQGQFLAMGVQANLTYDTAGNVVGVRGPDDPAYRNPFAEENFSYSDLVDKMLAELESFKAYKSREQYERQQDILIRFSETLESKSVA